MFSLILFALVGSSIAAPAAVTNQTTDKMIKLTHSIDDFGLHLLSHLEKEAIFNLNGRNPDPTNVLISPFSISSVLSTLLAGADHETHTQLYNTLGYSHEKLSENEMLKNYADLKQKLNQQLKATPNILEVADAVAIQQGYQILRTFQDALYGELLMVKNFRSEAHKSTEDINSWVSERTHGKIAKLFGQDLLPDTVLVLLNAIYFKGLWKKPFETKNTKRATFIYHGREGKEAELVDMMSAHGHFGLAQFADGDLLEVPYQNDSLSFLVYLPKVGAIKEQTTIASLFAESIKEKGLAKRVAQIRQREVNLHLPKFKIESKYTLNEPLKSLGIQDAFEQGKADFSRINGKRDLIVSKVAHKAFIEVNEEGSEAAAATGVVIAPPSIEIPVEFNVNRPFMFMIYDKQFQLVLFSGVVNKV